MTNEPPTRRSSRRSAEDPFHTESQHSRATARFNTPQSRAPRERGAHASEQEHARPHSDHTRRTDRRAHDEYVDPSERLNYTERPAHSGRTAHTQPYSHEGQYRRSMADDIAMAESSRSRQQQGRPSTSQNRRQSYSAMGTSAEPYRSSSRYGRSSQTGEPTRDMRKIGLIGVAVVVVLVGVITFWVRSLPVDVTINGTPTEVGGDKTAQYIYDQGAVSVTPGNFVDIEGEILEQSAGTPFTLYINGEEGDPEKRLKNGDEVVFENGIDIEEEVTSSEDEVIPFNVIEKGNGPIHTVTQEGSEGLATTKTGAVSNKTITTVTTPAEDRIYHRYYPDTNGEKVVAFTFDDGPWGDQTTQVLDILEKYDVKATFFTVGHLIDGEGAEQMKRAYDAGHQICTHTWDHAAGSGQGVNISYMSKDEQRSEITKGLDAIEAAIGTQPSTLFRAPGGNYPLEVWKNTEDIVSAEIGWNVDTEDWRQPGSDVILERLKSCTPGDIVLMHDGGGNRSQTIAAIEQAIPYLLDQGYTFITMDELMKYPPKADI